MLEFLTSFNKTLKQFLQRPYRTTRMTFVTPALAVICILLSSVFARAQEYSSPRATALGGYIAVSDDVFGLDWNASAMANGDRGMQISITNQSFDESVRNFGLLFRFGRRHTLAVRKTPDFITLTDFVKNPAPESQDDIVPFDLLRILIYEQDWAFGYAFRMNPRLSIGVDAKRHLFSNNLFSSSRYWGFSFSATYKLNDRLRLALVARNMLRSHYQKHNNRVVLQIPGEPDVRVFPVDYESFEPILSEPRRRLDIGAAARLLPRLLLSLDGYSNGGFAAGLEWQPFSGLFLRQSVSRKSDGLFKSKKIALLASGIGLRYGSARFDLTLITGNDALDIATQSSASDEFVFSRSNLGKEVQLSVLFFVK